MEVLICVPRGTDIKVIEEEYPDIWEDSYPDGDQRYFVGTSSDEEPDEMPEEDRFLSHDRAVECCGFAEGAIKNCYTLIEGNGEWAQGMISRKDFSPLAVSRSVKKEYKRVSNIFWAAFKRGTAAATTNEQTLSTS